MFKNLTDLPLKVLDIIPDLIAQNPDPAQGRAPGEGDHLRGLRDRGRVPDPGPRRRRQAQAGQQGQEEVQRQVLRLCKCLCIN